MVDPPVKGLNYSCDSGVKTTKGSTDVEGLFEFPGASLCSLSIGSTDIGSFYPDSDGTKKFTPYDIWGYGALKAAVLLQTLDENTDLSDGIALPAALDSIGGEIEFDSDLDLTLNTVVYAMLNTLGKTTANLVTEDAAKSYLYESFFEKSYEKAVISSLATANLTLPTFVDIGEKSAFITWSSNNTTCIGNDGVLGTVKNCVATITGRFTIDAIVKTKSWNVYSGDSTQVGPFALYGEYITQHAYFVNVVATETMDEEVSFVVVEKGATAPTLSSVDEFARHTRRFVYGDADLSTRPVYIAWKANLKLATYKDFVKSKSRIAYNASTHDWVLTAGKDYDLYIFKGSTSYTHSFTTLDYKTTLADYVAALPGARNQIPYNTGVDLISAKGSVERKEAEPMVHNVLFGPGYTGFQNFGLYFGVSANFTCSAGICGTLNYGPLLYYGTGTFLAITISGVEQADWLVFYSNYNDDGTLKTLTSPVTLEARYSGPKSSMITYKTVSE